MADGMRVFGPKVRARSGSREWVDGAREPRRLAETRRAALRRVSLDGGGQVDAALGGGAVAGSSFLLGGAPGAGKSTRALEWLSHVAASNGCEGLYVSGEMSDSEVRAMAERSGVDVGPVWVWETSDAAAVVRWLASHPRVRALVFDSLPLAVWPSARNETEHRRRTLVELMAAARSRLVVFVICHATKDGQIEGDRWETHAPTGALFLEPLALRVEKHRHGPSGLLVELAPLGERSARGGLVGSGVDETSSGVASGALAAGAEGNAR